MSSSLCRHPVLRVLVQQPGLLPLSRLPDATPVTLTPWIMLPALNPIAFLLGPHFPKLTHIFFFTGRPLFLFSRAGDMSWAFPGNLTMTDYVLVMENAC